MITRLFKKANQFRKQAYLNSSLYKTNKTYAFVGFGMHSLTNLYPILSHFGITLKYICTKHSVIPEHIRLKNTGSVFIHSMDIILNDPEVEGVFVSAHPEEHALLLNSLLGAGKKVFIEKPPCSNSRELENILAANPDPVVQVGLQRRFWPGNSYLIKNRVSPRSYIYRFCFGSYPQGNVFNELFIHAIDFSMFLFGDFSILSCSHKKDIQGITIQMHVKHSNEISGLIELSTHYSWNDPIDSLSIQYADELLEVKYPVSVGGRLKPKRILNLPSERFFRKPIISKLYFSINNLVIPSFDLNTLVLQGFYDELRTFVNIVENGKPEGYKNDLIGLIPVFKILDELKKGVHPTACL
jgi:virulence factor